MNSKWRMRDAARNSSAISGNNESYSAFIWLILKPTYWRFVLVHCRFFKLYSICQILMLFAQCS